MATDTGFGTVRFFDDFLGDTMDANSWAADETGNSTNFAINAQRNGVVRGTVTSNSSSDIAVLYGELNYRPNMNGPLTFEARITPITSLSQMIFAGLSDEKTVEKPIDYNGGTQTTTATDAVGFYYAGGETSATWRCGGVAAGTDSTHTAVSSRLNPVVATWQTLRVVVDADGGASFYINGEIIKENVSGCCTKTVSLMPFLAVSDDGAAASLDVDYVFVSVGRL